MQHRCSDPELYNGASECTKEYQKAQKSSSTQSRGFLVKRVTSDSSRVKSEASNGLGIVACGTSMTLLRITLKHLHVQYHLSSHIVQLLEGKGFSQSKDQDTCHTNRNTHKLGRTLEPKQLLQRTPRFWIVTIEIRGYNFVHPTDWRYVQQPAQETRRRVFAY